MTRQNDVESKRARDDTTEADDAVIGKAFVWSLLLMIPLVAIIAGAVIVLNWPKAKAKGVESDIVKADKRDVSSIEFPNVTFTDVTREAGITFVHNNGAAGQKLLPETMGGGVAFLDYDNDGDQDLLFVNSDAWPDQQDADDRRATMAMFANDGAGKFTDVTKTVGLDISLYGMGVAVGDYDNDGWRDVFISAVGKNKLYRNAEGKFEDVTTSAGVSGGDTEWGTSCGWFDFDNDGLLDLFVCNYVEWNKESDLKLNSTLDGKNRAYVPPTYFKGALPSLFHNQGNGTFRDVSARAGICVKNPLTNVPVSKSLGVVFADIDGDRFLDIVVANDTVQNLLFHNQKDGTFKEMGKVAGIAFDTEGNARGAMGIDAAAFRNSEQIGMCIGNFATEPMSLYVTQGVEMLFSDEATATGLGPQTRLELTFGLFFFDYDLDGRLDILAANGHLEEEINKIQSQQHYQQPPQLFWNAGIEETSEFAAVPSAKTGPDFHRPMAGRGATFADIDGDGDLDVLLTAVGDSPRLLRNDQALENHWVRFELTGEKCNRDAIGAWIELTIDDETLRRQVAPTRSYLSQSELPVTIGIGKASSIDKVVIRWPDGTSQNFDDVAIDQTHKIRQSADAKEKSE